MMGVNRRLSGGKHDLKGARKNPGVEFSAGGRFSPGPGHCR